MNQEGQSRLWSHIESSTNIIVGFIVALITWQIVAWALDIPMTTGKNLLIIGIFTFVSYVRSYVLRRIFNAIYHRSIGS